MIHSRQIVAGLALAAALAFVPLDPLSARPVSGIDPLVEAQIRATLAKGQEPPRLQPRSIAPRDVAMIVRNRVDRRLLATATGFTGRDFDIFVPGDGSQRQLATLSIRYPSAKIALQRIGLLKPGGGAFRQSKILTRFSAARRRDAIVIVYTESAGDQQMVALAASIAASVAAD